MSGTISISNHVPHLRRWSLPNSASAARSCAAAEGGARAAAAASARKARCASARSTTSAAPCSDQAESAGRALNRRSDVTLECCALLPGRPRPPCLRHPSKGHNSLCHGVSPVLYEYWTWKGLCFEHGESGSAVLTQFLPGSGCARLRTFPGLIPKFLIPNS